MSKSQIWHSSIGIDMSVSLRKIVYPQIVICMHCITDIHSYLFIFFSPGEYVINFGKYQGQSFRWLLENTPGYVGSLLGSK